VPLERVRHHDDLPKPGWRTRRVRWVYLDLDDRISHLPLLPFLLVFSQEDTFLPSLLVFQGFLPLLAHSLRIPWVVSTIEKAGGKALAIQADVANAEQVEAMVQAVGEALGPIDTLVLNAPAVGSSTPASNILSGSERLQAVLAPFTGSKWEVLESFVQGQLQSVFYSSQAVIPTMIKQQRGSIVFVSATIARRPGTGGGGLTIAVAKAAVESLVRNMAEELGPYGIRVNAVGAGHIVTDLNKYMPQEMRDQMAQTTPLRRNGRPEDVAAAIVYLASNQASFVTGAYLTVDGGKLIM
jgi:3-oxoacyl-[acyl-carrier protein] reductase